LINVHDISDALCRPLTGSNDWTRVEMVFNTSGHETLQVNCSLGGWGLASGRAWYDDLALEQLARFEFDYSYLFREDPPQAPRLGYYPGQTAIAEHAFRGFKPRVLRGEAPMQWRLVFGPDGMSIDADSGVPSWQHPVVGKHVVAVEARNGFGHDISEFVLIVVENDIPDGQVIHTTHIDFVLPPEGVSWFRKWKPHRLIAAQFELMRKLIGHAPTRDGKQVMKYQPDAGGGGLSGNPVRCGPGWWGNWNELDGWDLGIWDHEVGHNFNGQAPVTFYSDVEGYGGIYHHHVAFLVFPAVKRTMADPAAFGLSGPSLENYRRFITAWEHSDDEWYRGYTRWLNAGNRVVTKYEPDYFKIWGRICLELTARHGPEILEKSLRAMRTDGIPHSLRETAQTPLQRNAMLFCIMSHAGNEDLRKYFQHLGFEYDGEFYRAIDARIGEIVGNLPDEDGPGGWKKNPHNGRYYRLTKVDTYWHAAEVEARQFGGHLATVRSAQELEWLQSRFGSYPEVWVGLHDAARLGKWQWISGEDAQFADGRGDPSEPKEDRCFALLQTESGKWAAVKSPAQRYPGIVEILEPRSPEQEPLRPTRPRIARPDGPKDKGASAKKPSSRPQGPRKERSKPE
jgi:hypothetical protein